MPRTARENKSRQHGTLRLRLLLALALPLLGDSRVIVTSVLPSRGSLAGGTRVHIKGSGFSTNTGGTGNVVKIGQYFCDPIPLHCTVNQIACKTRPALEGSISEWVGWTDWLPVSVVVDGFQSECKGSCVFSYHYGWYHTPRITGLAPMTVEEGTILTVNGRFHSTPFEFEELRAPSMEIPLASVKIANRAAEAQRPENEPFGQSGTRCALFDQDIEEPYGVGETYNNGQEVRMFRCQVNGPREAGRYNFSVALLGTQMMNEHNMNMGESHVQSSAYLVDHDGVSFMLHHLAKVASVQPSTAGLSGGATLTITGSGFSNDKSRVRVRVGGDVCDVKTATVSRIECVLAPRGNTTDTNGSSFVPGAVQPGARGVRRRMWYDRGRTSIEGLRMSREFNSSDLDEVEKSLLESPINIQYARGDASGPHGQYTGFFRAPVSANYTFLLAADDYAMLWVGTRANTASEVEQLINWRSWVSSRAWGREQWNRGRDTNPIDRMNKFADLRAKRKVELQAGEFVYLDAHYQSGGGGDNFALAVVQHSSTVNRRDTPAGQDEKQFIDVSVPKIRHEVQRVTLKGANLGGVFRLTLGGKRTRLLSADAGAAEVGAAVRELLSNCQGAVGEVTDGGGSTFECFSGRGLEYRGLAYTTVDGDECIPWVETPYWDPWLAVVAGLDANLCRNPDYRSAGPWCVNAKRQVRLCALPRCGGSLQGTKNAPAVASFEDEEPNDEMPMTAAAEERDGVTPRIVKGEAFCGEGSLYMNNAWGMIRNFWRYDEGKDPAYEGAGNGLMPFGTSRYRYVCMAYRIPPTSLVAMLIRVQLRDAEGVVTDNHEWKTIYLTNTQHNAGHPKVGKWAVIADNTWRYDCLDLQRMLDTAADADKTLVRGHNHLIKDIIFYTDEVPRSNYASNEFWIDEFSISQTARDVRQSEYPQLPARSSRSPLRLVNVTKQTAGNERWWAIELSSDDCTSPNGDFGIDASALTGALERAEVQRVQEHMERIDGQVVVTLLGVQVAFSPYSNASQVQAAFAAAGVAGESVGVVRTGTCQTGFGWSVTFTHVAGDLPLMTARLSEKQGVSGASVKVYSDVDGGIVMGPISADYLHEAVTHTNLQVLVNEAAADCARDANNVSRCLFSYNDALTPTATAISSARLSVGTYQITITGSGFSPAAQSSADASVRVVVGALYPCSVISSSDTSVICKVTYPFLQGGTHRVELLVPGKGAATGQRLTLDYLLEIQSITPTNINRQMVNTLTITGAGFSPILTKNMLSVGGMGCEPTAVSASKLECTLGPANGGTRRRHLLATVDVQLSLSGTSLSATSNSLGSISASVPTISSVVPSKGAVGGGYAVTISGAGFSSTMSDNTVLLGATPCAVVSATSSSIVCTADAGSIGSGAVAVVVSSSGVSDVSSAPHFIFELSVTAVAPSPSVFGFGGGNQLTVSGVGFASGLSGNEYATPVIAVAGLQTFVVGLSTPRYTPEIHQLVVTAKYVSEVQRLTLPSTSYFELAFLGRRTERLSRTVEVLALQTALRKLMPAASPSVVVVSTPQGWQVEFPAELGNVDLLSASTCSSLVTACAAGGITVTELVAGAAPRGMVGLLLGRHVREWQERRGNSTLNMTQVAWAERLNVSLADNLQQLLSGHRYFGAIRVERRRASLAQVVWEVTYLDLTGQRAVPDIDDSAVIGGNVTMRRVQTGAALPEGTFQLRLGGRASEPLPLNATATQVQRAVAAFPDVLSASVFSVDDVPGRLLDRSYPRQWVVKVRRHGVAGASVARCTSPLYVDWDPSACPSAAPDLFLHHYPWYWPSLLPRPEDLGSESAKTVLQEKCDAEARSQQLQPSRCHARVPLESLPVCGEGSGVNPPCWTERFSSAQVRHSDGQKVVYTRDDSKTPSDTVKGYRFWTRADLKELLASQVLSVNHSVAYPSGVDASEVYIKAEQMLQCAASDVTATSLKATVPPLVPHGPRVAEAVKSDYLLRPVRHLSFSGQDGLDGEDRLTFQTGATLNGDTANVNTTASASLPYEYDMNSPVFTVEAWLLVRNGSKGTAPLLQNVGGDDFSGYALLLSSTGDWQFYLAAGCEASQSASVEPQVVGFSVVAARAKAAGTWSHVALSFDGAIQRIYVDGQQVSSAYVAGPYRRNEGSRIYLAGPCRAWIGQGACGNGIGDFVIDEALFYKVAVPAEALAAHAALLDMTIHAQLRVKSHNVMSPCDGVYCALQLKASSTAHVQAVHPMGGYSGSTVTIRGQGFTRAMVTSVSLGGGSCDSIAVQSDFQLTCTAQGETSGRGPVRVMLQDLGASLSSASFEWISVIRSITPSEGSLLGGTRLTIGGLGISSDVKLLSVTVGSEPCLVQSSSGGSIECILGEFSRPSTTSARVLPVALTVGGKNAQCGVDTGCSITATLAATPALRSLHPTARVTEGTRIVVSGILLPTEGSVSVRVGNVSCPVVVRNSTHLTCALERGVGGFHRLRVLFAAGYAADFLSQCCETIEYDVSITAVTLNKGAQWGSQPVTLTGAGFDWKNEGAVASTTRVFVGGRRARVRTATYNQVVFETPSLSDQPAIGIERELIWKKIRHCGEAGADGEACAGQQLRTCASTLSWGNPPVASSNRILAVPGSDGRRSDAALVDGDLETVWHSKAASSSATKLVFDLGAARKVTHIVVYWAGRSAAAQYRVSASPLAPTECGTQPNFMEELVAWRASSLAQWNTTGAPLAQTVSAWEITGSPSPSFSVNWLSRKGDILFHLSIRANENQIVMNSYLTPNSDGIDQWLVESRVNYATGTARKTWVITVDEAGFHLLQEKQEVFVYEHRLPWASFYKVESSSANVQIVYKEVPVWNQADVMDLGSFFFTPRVFMIELLGLRKDVPSFGIRDIVFVEQLVLPFPSSQPLLVEVGGTEAVCAGSRLCSFNYSLVPEVLSVNPKNGTSGTVITINSTALNVSNCASNKVTLSGRECVVESCGEWSYLTPNGTRQVLPRDRGAQGWIRCAISSLPGGVHNLQLTVDGVTAASHGMVFTYPVSIAAVTPAMAGYGGGYKITVTGQGFSSDASLVTASVCDFPCKVTKADDTSIECVTAPLADAAATPSQSMVDISITDGRDDAIEDVYNQAIVVSGGVLGPYLLSWAYEWSVRTVYLRFGAVDIARGMRVSRAILQVSAADTSCAEGSQIRIWAEAADHSLPFTPSVRGSLGARSRTSHHDWFTSVRWRWLAEAQESSDLSQVINEVLSRPGWRAGNALTLMLRQRTRYTGNSLPEGSCNMLSADYATKYAPKLRLHLANFTQTRSLPAESKCSVAIEVKTARDASSKCDLVRVPLTASASSSDVPSAAVQQGDLGNGNEDPNLQRTVLRKKRRTLTYLEARSECSSIGARLCRLDKELLVTGTDGKVRPFFPKPSPVDPKLPIMVPYEDLRIGPDSAHHNNWVQVSGVEDKVSVDEYTKAYKAWYPEWMWKREYFAENEKRTSLIPCCGVTGHPAYMAVDQDAETFWDSGAADSANLTLTVASGAVSSLSSIDIVWTDDYASEYRILLSRDGKSWAQVAQNFNGDGSLDSLSILQRCPTLVPAGAGGVESSCPAPATVLGESLSQQLHVKIEMLRPALGCLRFGIKDISVQGCSSAVTTAAAVSKAMFTARSALTPEVSAVVPERGTTAGGSEVTVTGRFFSTDTSKMAVSIGAFPCTIKSLTSLSGDQQRIVCLSSASGILHSGRKFVQVTVDGYGASVASESGTFWYIDTWSSRTTWGGKAPPTGCGSWVVDKLCTDTVHIPEGQVVLLDQSLPRFYLILIEGTLIFDRKDITLSANYILLRGGTLQIGTEAEPFTHKVLLTLFGHPKSMELPTFGSKVIACYECKMDIHGAPQVAWTQLAATVMPGATEILLQDAVAWPVDSKIVIATTDFESPISSHSEVATVQAVLDNGKRVQLKDIRVCPEYSFSGLPKICYHRSSLSYPHLGEVKTFDGRQIEFRAEVGLLSRNIVIQGDHDDTLCPLADTADDGVTKLSCNQFGAQIFLHSPGHESLVGRLSNFEIRNGGQAFRLGRYAIHWHMIGNLRESYQRNVSIHHSWNRGVAIHGINYLRLENNFAYHTMGHTFFIEDGPEEFNRLENNLAIKIIPSMNLLNTDQTPAGFWIVSCKNYIIRNHAVASRRYGIWVRPEISATGTSVNTPDVHPINIPVLEFRGNEAHSNGKYGLRIFDIYQPNAPSVIRDLFVWRNGKVGWTATVIGQIGFDGVIAVQNGQHVFESRATSVSSWDVCYIRNGLFVDYTGLPLARSFAATSDEFEDFKEMGGPMEGGILFPWNDDAGGGMSVSNVTFVNFKHACLRGCAHCGRGGSPVVGDGAFETRFEGMRFVNSSQRALFRHPNEAFFYDLDGSLTGSGVREDFVRGGSKKGSSFIGTSVHLPPEKCAASSMSVEGTGGSICSGLTFRRMWYHIRQPDAWIGKALCVRMPWQATVNVCEDLKPECNCLPYLKKAWRGNVWLAADGYRYNVQQKLADYELADPLQWDIQLWAMVSREEVMLTHRFLQWQVADVYGRPTYWTKIGSKVDWAQNYFMNVSACSPTVGYCGKMTAVPNWEATVEGALQYDMKGTYRQGFGMPGNMPILKQPATRRTYTIKVDDDGNGALHTMFIALGSGLPVHWANTIFKKTCPQSGCWPPPKPPEGEVDQEFSPWSHRRTWFNTTRDSRNPMNKLEIDLAKSTFGKTIYKVVQHQEWAAETPSNFENVWIPKWRKVVLDVSSPILGRLVIEGTLLINASSVVDLTATWIEIKGGSLIIARCDRYGKILGPFEGRTSITLLGTNQKLAQVHGSNPRETPELTLGKQGLPMGAGVLGVMGSLIAQGKPVGKSFLPLEVTAEKGATSVQVVPRVNWAVGDEIVISPSDFDMHDAEVRTISSVTRTDTGHSILHFTEPLQNKHYSGVETHGGKTIEIRSRVGLLTRNIVFRGEGQGEDQSYHSWNTQSGNEAAAQCGNGICEVGENSLSCNSDCVGPAYEYGVSILVGAYDEEYIGCDPYMQCQEGYRREFAGSLQLDNVEMRYFGQNDLRAGLELKNLRERGANVSITNVAMNRGYYRGIDIQNSDGANIDGNLIFRSHLPTLRILGGKDNIISNNLAIVGIFWHTHRGAIQGKGLSEAKLNAMIGMFHDGGIGSILRNNVAAGSERAGFSGAGVACGDQTSFVGNVAHSSLAGYWFDFYRTPRVRANGCAQLFDLTAFKIWEYGIYSEVFVPYVNIIDVKLADCRVGISLHLSGAASLEHVILDAKVSISNSLIVGHSGNGHCDDSLKPSLYSCAFYMAYCNHLPSHHVGIYVPAFQGGSNMAPLIKPWWDAGSYPALYGHTEVEKVTFVKFDKPCTTGRRANQRDFAISGIPDKNADNWPPVYLKEITKIQVSTASLARLPDPLAMWINQADCIDMDCDGPRQALISDEDGTFIGGAGGAILPRAEKFSEGSFFGLPFKDDVNKPYMESFVPEWVKGASVVPADGSSEVGWGTIWYPNVPVVMRVDKQGNAVKMQETWLKKGFGIPRDQCILMDEWNGWKCPSSKYTRLVIENMDKDHEIRRVSPVAVSSDGYTNLLNGCMDHGWCFSYTCLKRLMTFWSIVKVGSVNTVHFTGTNPQSMRLHLPSAKGQDKVIVKIYYQSSMRLQVFVGSIFVEDLNVVDGKSKSQLVQDGRLSPNNPQGGYTDQHVDQENPCNIGGAVADVIKCLTPSNVHGANRFIRQEGMLEILVAAHDSSSFIEIRSMPVVAVSMGVSTSVADFYKVKDSFLSNLAFTLGIDVKRITIVDVVAGNARRRNLLASSALVNFEVEPSPSVEFETSSVTVLENAGTVTLRIIRSVNILGECGISYVVRNQSSDTAVPGVNFVEKTGQIKFKSKEVSKDITIDILSEEGYRSEDVVFTVSISDAENATLGLRQLAVATVRNVHMPPPSPPVRVLSGSSSTAIMISWSSVSWPGAPSDDYNQTLAQELECRHPDVAPIGWQNIPVPFASSTTAYFGGLSTYRKVQCRVRVQSKGGWSAWSKVSQDMFTLEVCGDGARHGDEQCDDAGTTSGDGCSAICIVEAGYACAATQSGRDVCSNGCMNGTVESGEACDDFNAVANDGCDATCRIERGFSCDNSHAHTTIAGAKMSVCAVIRGDAFRVVGKEECDDGNNINGDGCSTNAMVESGWTCIEDALGKSACKKCGNGKLEDGEVCDDSGASEACLGCNSVKPGWVCVGTICVAGPASTAQPVLSSSQETSLLARWTQPDSHGLPISRYVLELERLDSTTSAWERALSADAPAVSTILTLVNLTSSTPYRVRVSACNTEGCSPWSEWSAPLSTLKRVVPLTEIGAKVGDAAVSAASSSGVQIQNGSIGVAVPPPEPKAPPASAVLNATAIAAAEAAEAAKMEQQFLALVPRASDFEVGFSSSEKDRTVSESSGKLRFTVELVRKSDGSTQHQGTNDPISAQWQIVTSTVEAPGDVAKTAGFVAFTSGDVGKTLEIDINDNADLNYGKGDKTFVLRIVNVIGGASILAQRSAVKISIVDNEVPASVAITAAKVSTTAGSEAEIAVDRSGWMAGALKLQYRIDDVTTKAGEDYTVTSEATLGAGSARGSISIATLNAKRGKQIKCNVILVGIKSECRAGDGLFQCAGDIKADSHTAEVMIEPMACGDGVRGAEEKCDDGNSHGEDGCSETCSVEAGFDCKPQLDRATSNAAGGDICSTLKAPPAASVFLQAMAKMVGVPVGEFVGAKRRIFRQSVADSVKIELANVVVSQVQSMRRSESLEVYFQMTVREADKESKAQALWDAVTKGTLTKKLNEGGLNVKVSEMSPPKFVSSDGLTGDVTVKMSQSGAEVAIAVLVPLFILAVASCIYIYRKSLAALCGSNAVVDEGKPQLDIERKGSLRPEDQESIETDSALPQANSKTREEPCLKSRGDEPQEEAEREQRMKGEQDVRQEIERRPDMMKVHEPTGDSEHVIVRPRTATPSGAQDDFVFRTEMQQRLEPLWGRIVDEFVLRGESEGRFLTEEQIVGVVHQVFELACARAKPGDADAQISKVHSRDISRLLEQHAAIAGLQGSLEGTDYLSLCEMLAPDLLSRRAFQLFCALRDKRAAGVCVAELQHALMLGRIAPADIEAISGSSPLPYPCIDDEPERKRILFSRICVALSRVASADEDSNTSGPPQPPNPIADMEQSAVSRQKKKTRRSKLERDLQASCDGLAAAASFADTAKLDGNRDPTPRGHRTRPSTGRIGAKPLAPLHGAVAKPDTSKDVDFFMSKFEPASSSLLNPRAQQSEMKLAEKPV